LNVPLAGGFDGLQTSVTLLAAQGFQLFDSRGLPDVFPEDRDVDVFGEAFDQAVTFGERGSAFEEQARATGLQLIEERIERPTNPKVFFDVLLVGAEAVGSADKEVAALLVARGQYGLKTLGHRLLEPLAFLMIGAGVRLESFAFPAEGGSPAFGCWSRSRTITRIHSGSADRPLRKSF
jgi:hypothetical protein